MISDEQIKAQVLKYISGIDGLATGSDGWATQSSIAAIEGVPRIMLEGRRLHIIITCGPRIVIEDVGEEFVRESMEIATEVERRAEKARIARDRERIFEALGGEAKNDFKET